MNNINIDVSELEFSLNVYEGCNSLEDSVEIKKIDDDKIAVGYLSVDDTPENPLEIWDGSGRIYTSHRFSGKHGEMQEALGLDSDWQKDLDLVDEPEFDERLGNTWAAIAVSDDEFKDFVREELEMESEPTDESGWFEFAKEVWDDYRDDALALDFTDTARERLWDELQALGKIGNPFVVTLDCYSHGGEAWSISGEGYQCRFDTASNAGVWVPDECLEDQMASEAKVLSLGAISRDRTADGSYAYSANWSPRGEVEFEAPVMFGDYHAALEWIKGTKEAMDPLGTLVATEESLQDARKFVAEEYARNAVELYNQYLSGDCYGVVIEVFEKADGRDSWNSMDTRSVWGFFGEEYAKENVSFMFDESVNEILAN